MSALLFLFVKQIFSFIDRMVVFVIKYLYQLIVAIADTNVFGNLIYQYLGRIYTFLSVFMVFKLSISIINYIVNPDSMTDKNKGFGKLITNVVISLILLAVTPNIFEIAFDLQKDLLNSNAVYQIVTGKQLDTGDGNQNMYENAKVSAESIAFGVFSGFVYQVPNEDSDEPSKSGNEFGAYCDPDDVKSGCKENLCQTTSCLLDMDTVTAKQNKYWWLISTACGCVVAYILLGFCVDTAVRSVKLGFLQIIAPIPIMLRMDPGAKDDKFQKWLMETIKTFISLFIRLAALFFAIDLINVIMNPNAGNDVMSSYSGAAELGGGGLTGVFVKIFVIIGCLLFAKQFPQLLSDLLGIKLDGDGFSLKKKMSGIPGLGAAKMVGAGALGFAGGMAANTWAGVKNWDKSKTGIKGTLSNLNKFGNSLTTGAFSSAYRGVTSKEKNMFKAAGAGISGAAAARNLRADRKEIGADGISGAASRFGAKVSNLAGIESGATRFDKMASSLGNISSAKKEIDTYLEATNGDVKAAKARYDAAVQTGDFKNQKSLKAALDAAKDQAILSAGEGSTEAVLMKKYNETIKEANSIFNGATYADGTAVKFAEASGYLNVKDSEGQAKGTNTQLKNDGISVGNRTWSSEHSGVKEKN